DHFPAVIGKGVRSAARVLERERGRVGAHPRHEARGLSAAVAHERGDSGDGEEDAPQSARVVIVYLKVSGSRLSRRSPPVSACGYMRKPTLPACAFGSFTSCATLYASQF